MPRIVPHQDSSRPPDWALILITSLLGLALVALSAALAGTLLLGLT